jgi:hypothetical protein
MMATLEPVGGQHMKAKTKTKRAKLPVGIVPDGDRQWLFRIRVVDLARAQEALRAAQEGQA